MLRQHEERDSADVSVIGKERNTGTSVLGADYIASDGESTGSDLRVESGEDEKT